MAEKLFYELDIDKRNRIINVVLKEFAQYSYNEASTNRIVKKASIGKGSLFKYFTNKEDLYFYVLDYVIDNLVKDLKDKLPKLKGDIFEIILQYAEVEFNWHMKNPDKYNLLKRAFIDDNSNIYKKTLERYKFTGESFYYKLLEDANVEGLRWSKEKTLDILKWILEGFNEEFIKKIDQDCNINDIKDFYVKELKGYINILKEGLCK